MASRTWTPRSPSTSSDSSDTTMLDAPTHLPLTPTRPRQPSLSVPAPMATTHTPTATAPAPAPFSLLLSLPRELRDRVYTLALASPFPFWWPGQAPMKHNVAAPLLRANHQIHAEAAPLLYTANKFLFSHPSDCTVFRVVASPHAARITTVYFRIREKDLPLWQKYLGSKKEERCLKHDLPRLQTLWIFLRCGSASRFVGQLGGPFAAPPALGAMPPAMAVHVQAVQTALGQQVAALQQQVQHLTAPVVPTPAHTPTPTNLPTPTHTNLPIPPPPPPPPPPPFAHFAAALPPHHAPQPPNTTHNILATFLRHERELGIESLCLSLRDTLHDTADTYHPTGPAVGGHRERRAEDARIRAQDGDREKGRDGPEVKIVCIMRVPKAEVGRLVRLYPDELSVDRGGDARTRFRRLHGVEICVEITGVDE